jgi:hypothetical protein
VNDNPFILHRKRLGTIDDPYVEKSETLTLDSNAQVILTETPDYFHRVKVIGEAIEWSEVQYGELEENQFHVDYNTKTVVFNSIHAGKQLTFEYMGTGNSFISADLVYTIQENNNVIEVLSDIIEGGREGLEAMSEIANFQFVGKYDSTLEYKKFNMVTYDLEMYIALANVSGESPNVSSNWQQATNSFSWKNIYDSSLVYTIGDMVVDANNRNAYISIVNNNTGNLLSDTTKWHLILSVDSVVSNAEAKISDMEALIATVESNESIRQTNEQTRITNESARESSEATRNDNEQSRILAEDTREISEQSRVLEESNRVDAESSRMTAEAERDNAESSRVSSEGIREASEQERISAESVRENNESTRIANETQRQSDFSTAITNAETATNNANTAAQNTQDIVDNTEYIETYNPFTQYEKNNIIGYNGSSFIAKQDTLGNTPVGDSNDIYWGLLALRGVDGEGSVSTVNSLSPDANGNVIVTADDLGAEETSNKGIAGGYAGLDSNAKVPLSQLPDMSSNGTTVVDTIAERDSLIDMKVGDRCIILAVSDGSREGYIWDGTSWLKDSDTDWENVSLDWVNISGRPSSTVTDIDDAVLKKHDHTNKTVLDSLSDVDGQLQYNGTDVGSVTSVNGQTGDVVVDAEDEILQQDTEPTGIEEGRLWLDTSDSTYQGTVFQELEENIGDLATLQTTDKTTVVNAINEVKNQEVDTSTLTTKEEFNEHKAEKVSDDVHGLQSEFVKKADKTLESWISPVLVNGWEDLLNNESGYYKNNFGEVMMIGKVRNGTETDGTEIFTLPEGYRPLKSAIFQSSAVYYIVYPDGRLTLWEKDAGSSTIDLGCISFRADQ